jgi:hypothetical protein
MPPPRPSTNGPRLSLQLAVLLFPLTAGVLTGATLPLLLAVDPEVDWHGLASGTCTALLLAAPAAHWLASRLLRPSTSAQKRVAPFRQG